MVKKIVPDDNLQATYLWDNMDKIVSALLFIMHESYTTTESQAKSQSAPTGLCIDKVNICIDEQQQNIEMKTFALNQDDSMLDDHVNKEPSIEAELLLKELSSKVDYTTITRIIKPMLVYMDTNDKAWTHETFTKSVFEAVMMSVKQQHAIVIKELMKHLDANRATNARIKTCILKATSTCIHINAMHSVGTTSQFIDIFTNLLKHLNFSLETNYLQQQQGSNSDDDEICFQNEILDVMKNFTTQLPDYAKNDLIMLLTRQINTQQFTYNSLSNTHEQQQATVKQRLNELVRNKYLDALYEICSNYKPVNAFSTAFASVQFLEDILRLTIMYDPESRNKSQRILHYLLDKYNYVDTFLTQMEKSSTILDSMKPYGKQNKEDIYFMRKYGRLFLSHINESLFIGTNAKDNFKMIFLTLCLFLIGTYDDEFLVDFLCFGLHVQNLALINYLDINSEQKTSIHSFLTAYFDLVARLSALPMLVEYVEHVNNERKQFILFPTYVYGKKVENKKRKDPSSQFDQVSKDFISALKQQPMAGQDGGAAAKQLLHEDVKFIFNRESLMHVCEKSGIALPQQNINTEYSLAIVYINQIKIDKTCLVSRSVNSISGCSTDAQGLSKRAPDSSERQYDSSLVNFKNTTDGNDNSESAYTSYDSLSNLSEDLLFGANGLSNNKIRFLVGEVGQAKQGDTTLVQTLMKQINAHKRNSPSLNDDVFTFDTIKKYLLSPFIVENTNGSATSSTKSNMGGLIKSSSTQMIQTDYLLDHQYFDNDQQNMDKLDIINDFKKKTFDEIKCDLNKQTQYSVDKFNKVLDFIQNELSPQLSKKESASCVNSSNSTINNLSMNSLSLITTPIMAHKATIKDIESPIANPNSSQLVCLNDIQFPRSFIY